MQGERAKIYTLTPEQFIKRGIVINGRYKEFDVWRSAYAYFFPKCKGFADKSSRERAYSYGIYDTAGRLFPSAETTFALAKEIVGYIYYFHNKRDTYCLDIFGEVSDQSDLFQLAQYFFEPEIVNYSLDSIEMCRYVHRVYTELLLSKHFLYFVCDRPTLSERKRKLRLIEEFYPRLDYIHLKTFLRISNYSMRVI